MSARILAGYLDADTLRAAVQSLAQAGATVILEGLTALHMWSIEDSAIAWGEERDPAVQEEGWMFHANFELRWQRLRGYPSHLRPFRARIITDNSNLLQQSAISLWQSSDGAPASVRELSHSPGGEFYLWGEAVCDDRGIVSVDDASQMRWYEKEVPRMFAYPLASDSNARRAKIITKTYTLPVDQASGLIADANEFGGNQNSALLHRFVALIPTQE